jgi:hypothetical protein
VCFVGAAALAPVVHSSTADMSQRPPTSAHEFGVPPSAEQRESAPASSSTDTTTDATVDKGNTHTHVSAAICSAAPASPYALCTARSRSPQQPVQSASEWTGEKKTTRERSDASVSSSSSSLPLTLPCSPSTSLVSATVATRPPPGLPADCVCVCVCVYVCCEQR